MDLRLQGNVAVVVGAAQGIGRAIALAFHQEGASVVVIDQSKAVMLLAQEMNAQELAHSNPVQALGLVADVTDYEAMRQAAQSVGVKFGRCDHVVYAVGVGSGKYGFPFWTLEPADWPRVLNVNLLGAVHTAHAFAPGMAEECRGTPLAPDPSRIVCPPFARPRRVRPKHCSPRPILYLPEPLDSPGSNCVS